MDEDKKENFRMEIVKKAWFLQRFNMLVEVYLISIFRTCAVETVKSCISLFLFLANLCFQVVSVLVKTRLLHISYTFETFHKSLVTRFLTMLSFLRIT